MPLATLLVATRAVTRGGENARRLSVLFDAAVRAQTLSDTRQVVDALVDDARRLLRIKQIEVRATPPGAHEVGAQLRDGQRDRWIVAPGTAPRPVDDHRRPAGPRGDGRGLLRRVRAAPADRGHDPPRPPRPAHQPAQPRPAARPGRARLQMSRRRGTRIALLFVDLDGFKPVNDRFGHAAGDAVLIDVAQRLSGCVRQSDTVARLGGDEFALLLEDVHPPEVSSACDRILAALSRGAHVAGHQLSCRRSIGVAFGDSSETAESMLRNADLAMYEAKARGKNQWVEYERAIGRSRLQRLELVESLRASVAAGDLRWSTSPSSAPRPAGSPASRRWRAGSPTGSTYPRTSSSGSRRRPGWWWRSATSCWTRPPRRAGDLRGRRRDDQRQRQHLAKQLREPDFVPRSSGRVGHDGRRRLVLEITERDGIGNDTASLRR